MSQGKMTRDKIARRLADNLRRNDTDRGLSQSEAMPANAIERNSLPVESPDAMTFSQRLRYNLVVRFLHKINLTSYRRLRRATAALDATQMDLTKLARERDEIAQLLRLVASDRDRLAAQGQTEKAEREQLASTTHKAGLEQERLTAAVQTLSVEHERLTSIAQALSIERERLTGQLTLEEYKAKQFGTELELLRTAHAQLQQDYETLRSISDEVSHKNTIQITLGEYKEEQLRNELEILRTAHTRLQQDHETLRSVYDQVSHKNTALEAVMNVRSSEHPQDLEETVMLAFTVEADAVVPRSAEVDHSLAAWGKVADEDEDAALYYVLETSFRGSEEEIKYRQREYLPHLTIVDPALPLVDLGCGRGEFLELMREQAIRALGVDTNSRNIEELKRKGLEVYQQDAAAYLANTASESLAAVTAFQVIEHVPVGYLRKLIRLAYEKLAPGGFILLETVNPYCLETYRTFYLDPTHQNPVPLDLLSLLLQFYGFTDKQIFFQSPIKPSVSISQSQNLSLLYQGYALMGRKPPAR